MYLKSKNYQGTPDEGYPTHTASVLPRDIQRLILEALDRGWDPAQGHGSFPLESHPEVELSDYRVA